MSTTSDKAHQIALAATRIADHAEDVRRIAGEIERQPGTSVVKSSTLNEMLRVLGLAAKGETVRFQAAGVLDEFVALRVTL